MSKHEASTLAYLNLEPDLILTTLEALGFRCDGWVLTLISYDNRGYLVGFEDASPVIA